jgi:hypothetical protein
MLTAAVRDLHAALPGQFVTDVRTSADGLRLHNPHVTEPRNAILACTYFDKKYRSSAVSAR